MYRVSNVCDIIGFALNPARPSKTRPPQPNYRPGRSHLQGSQKCTDTSDLTLRTQDISAPCVWCRSVSNFCVGAEMSNRSVRTLRHQCRNVSDTSALKCMRHFGPRTKWCLECRHCLKKCRPTLCSLLWCNGSSAWKMINKSCRPIMVCHVRVSSRPLSARLQRMIIGEKAEKCNCSEHRLNDVSADRNALVRQQLRLLLRSREFKSE